MNERRTHIIAGLEINREHVIAYFQSLTPAQLETRVYQDGARWTVQQVLAHLITIERSMQWLFKDILAGGPGSPEDFDFERYNRTQPKKLDGKTIDELIAQFQSIRSDTISIVSAMSDEDFGREGRHAYHGHGKLERFIKWAYEHVDIHLADLRKILHNE